MPETPKPLSAFYCCYLLRSKSRKSYYIGSTPNPARRLAQHNGNSKGGAKRTSYQGKRPWEMTCIVTGFPSKFAALQFEWAWQNTHATRHIERDVRDARVEELGKKGRGGVSVGAGGRRKRPPMSLEARLKNMYYLLNVNSFKRWPLKIRFFSKDVFEAWGRHMAKMPTTLRKGVTVLLTPAELAVQTTENEPYQIPAVIRDIHVAYEDCKAHVEKAEGMVNKGSTPSCGICKNNVDASTSLALICPVETCRTISHMSCLSHAFLREEDDRAALIPLEGTCPGCRTPVKWSTMMKELSLRIRGPKEVEALFKPKRRRKADGVSESDTVESQALDEEDEELDETWLQDIDDEDDDPTLPKSRSISPVKASR
jgi:structure-specific endonuclease subunit SLX1